MVAVAKAMGWLVVGIALGKVRASRASAGRVLGAVGVVRVGKGWSPSWSGQGLLSQALHTGSAPVAQAGLLLCWRLH